MKVVNDVHAPMGIVVTCIITLLAVSGVIARSRLIRANEDQQKMLIAKKIHKGFAYLMLITSQVTISAGIYSYTHNRDIETILYYLSIALFFFLFLVFEVSHQLYLRQEIKFNEPLNTMSDEEFQMEVQKGKQKLVILDDLVLDVTQFAGSHPGGRFLLEKNVGKDISRYFYGGYSYEPLQGAKNNTHSNYARTIVNSLIVARYVKKRGQTILNVNKSFKITDNPDNTVTTFELQERGGADLPENMKCFYPDLDMVGRHFLVQEYDLNRMSAQGPLRQYTVASTMQPTLYSLLVQGLESNGDGEIK